MINLQNTLKPQSNSAQPYGLILGKLRQVRYPDALSVRNVRYLDPIGMVNLREILNYIIINNQIQFSIKPLKLMNDPPIYTGT